MKKIMQLMFASILMMVAASALAVSGMQAIQIFACEFNDDATPEQVMEMTSAWLKAAKETKGGENLDAYIRFPIAEGSGDESDFRFVITTPTFEEWGAFTDAYEDSPVAKVDDQFDDLADCHESAMWEGVKIK
jgi:hypothetical protein